MLVLNMNVFWIVFNLIVLFFLLKIFLFKPLKNIMNQRTELIQNEISAAEAQNKEAKELKDQYSASLQNARLESDEIVSSAKDHAKVQYDQIVEKANEDAAQIVQQAQETAQMDREKILREAQSEIADVAMAAAIRLIGGSVDDAANRKLLDDYLSEEGMGQ